MPITRSRRVLICGALVLLLVAVGLLAAACGSGATTTTTAAAATTTSGAAPASSETTAAPASSETTAPPASTETTAASTGKPFTFGMLFVGPYNDSGWSQANYEGGTYVESKLPGAKMIYVDKVNTADRPGTTPEQ